MRNLVLVDVKGDGNCFFRAISLILTGDETSHFLLREAAVAVLKQNQSFFEPFLVESGTAWETFTRKAGKDRNWATNLEVQALSVYLNAAITVYTYDPKALDYVRVVVTRLDSDAAKSISSVSGITSVTDLLPFSTPPEEDTLTLS
jgi:hypothetical protein